MPFNLGPMELIAVVVVLLVLFGAKKLPDIGRSLGKGLKEFKKATSELTEPIKEEFSKDKEYITSVVEPEDSKETKSKQESKK